MSTWARAEVRAQYVSPFRRLRMIALSTVSHSQLSSHGCDTCWGKRLKPQVQGALPAEEYVASKAVRMDFNGPDRAADLYAVAKALD